MFSFPAAAASTDTLVWSSSKLIVVNLLLLAADVCSIISRKRSRPSVSNSKMIYSQDAAAAVRTNGTVWNKTLRRGLREPVTSYM